MTVRAPAARERLPEGVRDRKAEHIRLALDEGTQLAASYFEEYRFDHRALPEIDLAEVDTATTFLGKRLAAPLLVSCMTGGTELANRINLNLAAGAEMRGVAVGVGSQRRAIEDPEQAASFRVRQVAPTIPLLANLGAVQLNYGFGSAECRRAVEMIDADALVLHLNPLQEAIQPEGQCDFSGLLPKMARVAAALPVPVIAKEVGCGLSEATGRALAAAGIRILDTAGLGGTSWARIEARRAANLPLGELFADWGIPTPESIRQLAAINGVTVIGSGGVRSGLDVAKALALGAGLAGLAYPFLAAATESPEAVAARIDRLTEELRIAMFCLGVRTVEELKSVPIHRRSLR
jgi:isopentenyl-diphosphate Delta-isomerase